MGCGWNCNPPESDKCGLPLASKHGSKFPKSHLVCHLVWARKTVATNCLHPWGQCFAPTIWLWRVTAVKLGARGVASQLPEMVTKQSSKVEYLPITLKFWDSFSFTCQAAAVNSAGHTGVTHGTLLPSRWGPGWFSPGVMSGLNQKTLKTPGLGARPFLPKQKNKMKQN